LPNKPQITPVVFGVRQSQFRVSPLFLHWFPYLFQDQKITQIHNLSALNRRQL